MSSGSVRTALGADDLERTGQLVTLRYDAAAAGITLKDRVLIEDDAPGIGKPDGASDEAWYERLREGVRLRKELVLDDGRAGGAWLTWCGREVDDNDAPLHICVNGVDLVRPPTKYAHPQCKQYYTSEWAGSHFDNWFVVALPVGALRAGANTIDLWAESADTSWEVMVAADTEYACGSDTRRAHPDRSAKSRDGGQTWDRERLGWRDEIDGEYCIRLSLDRYAAEGVYRSAAIDLAGESDDIRRALAIRATRLRWEAATPEGTAVTARVRFGYAPLIERDAGWSDWEAVDGLQGEWASPSGRWLQFEARLTTTDPLVTPSLCGLTIETDVEMQISGPPPRVRARHNGQVTRSSVDYAWEDPAALADLRARFELDTVVAGATTEFEAQLRLMHWAYRIPIGQLDPHAWRYEDLPQLQQDADGGIVQLGPYDKPRREGHCLFCNLTLIAALTAFGYPARWVNISSKHTYGHEVTEVWSNDFDKWVFLDATRDYYMHHPDSGIPLGLIEIGARVAEVLPAPVTWDNPIQHQVTKEQVVPGPVRVVYRQPDHGGPVFGAAETFEDLYMIGHLQMPLRNDFSSRPRPVPRRLTSNWGSDQFYVWTSVAYPPKLEYAHDTSRPQDWEPRLNQAQVALLQTDARTLAVTVDTVTPWLDVFEVKVDGEDWVPQAEPQWAWPLHEGLNHLAVRVRNRFGVRGPEARVEVVATA